MVGGSAKRNAAELYHRNTASVRSGTSLRAMFRRPLHQASHPLRRLGDAYGLDGTAHALATIDRVKMMLDDKVREGMCPVGAFIEAMQKAF